VNKSVLITAIVAVLVAASVTAWWLIGWDRVDSCADSDGGLDFFTTGTIHVLKNQTYKNFTDFCMDNITVAEFACSEDVLNISGFAGVAGENCNGTGNASVCVDGRCV